jgi:tetratricopeptide (TPR) repeat protein
MSFLKNLLKLVLIVVINTTYKLFIIKIIMGKKIIMIFFLVISQTIYCQTYSDFYNSGLEKEKNQNFKGAIRDYVKAFKIDSTNIDVLERIGFAKSNIGKYRSAIKIFEKLIQRNPNNVNYYYVKGVMEYTIGKFDDAIINYSKAIKLSPNDSNLYSERGRCKFENKDYEGALKDYNKSLSINSINDELYFQRDKVLRKLKINNKGRNFRAIQTNVNYIRLKPNN